jgi:hypothetical protein
MMTVNPEQGPRLLESLSRAVGSWVRAGDARPLTRWLDRELDAEGVPIRLAIPAWQESLAILAEAKRCGRDWPEGCESQLSKLILASLRFARPDGSPAVDLAESDRGSMATGTWRQWADWYRGTGVARVLHDWFAPGQKDKAPPPLPAWSSSDRVLSILRPDWRPDGDFLAIDHRDAHSCCRFELFGGGRPWLGPDWSFGAETAPTSRPRPRTWMTGALADLAEWSYRVGTIQVTQSALLLRGRRLALVAVLAESRTLAGPTPPMRLALPPRVAAAPMDACRAVVLTAPKKRGSVQVLPIGLPCLAYPTDRGRFLVEGCELVLNQASAGRRCWLPLLVSWDPDRHRKTLRWRVLTVSERARAARPERAFAARVSWGRDEHYVVYRSLGPPAPRAFLGHQTRARFLLGQFTTAGDVKPILSY